MHTLLVCQIPLDKRLQRSRNCCFLQSRVKACSDAKREQEDETHPNSVATCFAKRCGLGRELRGIRLAFYLLDKWSRSMCGSASDGGGWH